MWFLNCAASYLEHTKKNKNQNEPTDTKMSWIEPFGSPSSNNCPIMGSLSFPRLQLGSNRNVLPTQTDSSNCGTATTATVAIILRDCFGSLERFEAYEEAFNLTRMVPSLDSSKGQYVCNLTKSILQPLPLDLQGKLFLPTLRAEWLTVFDRLAFLLHEKIPKKPPTVDYNTVKSMIKWPCDLKSAGKPNTEVADDSAAVHSLMTLASISTQKAHANITTNPSIIPKVKKATVAMSRKKPPVLPTTRNRIDDVVLGSAGKTPTLLERILTPPTKRQRVLDKRHAQDGDTIASLTQPLMVPSATKQDSNPVKNRNIYVGFSKRALRYWTIQKDDTTNSSMNSPNASGNTTENV
jgi:hypothetical protein